MIFALPAQRLEDLLSGLKHVEKYESKLPRNPNMIRERVLPENYRKMAAMIGMDLEQGQ